MNNEELIRLREKNPYLEIMDERCILTDEEQELVNKFLILFYDKMNTIKLRWLGVPIQKNPLDAWVMQEIIVNKKPDIIIECGSAAGGSALFFYMFLFAMKNGIVISIDDKMDINEKLYKVKRISFIKGSSTDPCIVEKVKSKIKKDDKVMVVLDSDHFENHVSEELRIYSDLVTVGQYLIVEDTCIKGNPIVWDNDDGGPFLALKKFLKMDDRFIIDGISSSRFLISYNPAGYLVKIKE